MNSPVYILNGSSLIRPSELGTIAGNISSIYGRAVRVVQTDFNLDDAFDPSRGQYNSTIVLAPLSVDTDPPDAKQVGLVDVDLFIPVLTFVFGEAELAGRAAIVSTHRLSNQYYGLPRSHDLFLTRIEKELIHELGHVFGLYHCRQFECVMRSSTYVEEIDMKKAVPCPECATRLVELLATL